MASIALITRDWAIRPRACDRIAMPVVASLQVWKPKVAVSRLEPLFGLPEAV
jgi:hypothetical protein